MHSGYYHLSHYWTHSRHLIIEVHFISGNYRISFWEKEELRNPWEMREDLASGKKNSFESKAGRESRIKEYIKNKAKLKQQINKSVRQTGTKKCIHQEQSNRGKVQSHIQEFTISRCWKEVKEGNGRHQY